jgi:hypothetical protein
MIFEGVNLDSAWPSLNETGSSYDVIYNQYFNFAYIQLCLHLYHTFSYTNLREWVEEGEHGRVSGGGSHEEEWFG